MYSFQKIKLLKMVFIVFVKIVETRRIKKKRRNNYGGNNSKRKILL
jgi:hypothetical protein